MATIRGMQMPEPSSGGGGGLTNALMGIFRERTRAQKQLELMAYQSAMGVASHVAKTKLGAEALSQADIAHTKAIYNPATWGEEDWAKEAARVRQGHFEEAGIRDISGGKISYQSRGTVVQKPKDPKSKKARSRANLQNKASGVGKSKTPSAAVVNEATQAVTEPNVGNRAPKASKGGFKGAGVPMPSFTAPGEQTTVSTGGGLTEITPGKVKTGTRGGTAAPKTRKPRVKKPGTGQTPSGPTMGGMNA